MTIPTPTPDTSGAGTPGLDVATLNRLANDLFAGPPFTDATAGIIGSASTATDPPTAMPGAVADVPGPTPPMAPPAPTPAAVPSTPYYFLAEANPLANELRGAPPSWAAPPQEPGFYFVEPVAARDRSPIRAPFDVDRVRGDFPILAERVNGHDLVWFDNGATTQKPQVVIDRLAYYYAHENSNIHRAAHELAARSTDAYEAARSRVARFLNAGSADEIVFVRGTTEAINLVAQTWGRQTIGAGDEIVVSHLEHHANIVPWQRLAEDTGATLRVIPVDDRGQVRLDEYGNLLSDRTRLVAVAHVSNALGTVVPVHTVVEMAHAAGARVLVDGAQAVAHQAVDLDTLDADFYVFSGHKIFGPTGIGALYAKAELLESMPPWQGGGNMIRDVTFERITYQEPPGKFEAGTGNIADAVGLGVALDYVEKLGLQRIAAYEHELLAYATEGLGTVPGLHLIGTAVHKAPVLSFVLDGHRPEQVGTALNKKGIAVRAGHHCAQPILRRFGHESTVRASLAMYNTCAEIDLFVDTLHELADRTGR